MKNMSYLKIKGKEYMKRNLPGAQTTIMSFGPVSVVGAMGRRKGGGGSIVEWWMWRAYKYVLTYK
jgi:hypothetical protein